MPYFSVVIPLFNKENYVRETLQSVLDQTFTNFEVILVNDVSTDNSVEIVKEFKDKRIRIIHHEVNGGLSASRNTGIRNSRTEYIAFLDADDRWRPEFLETIRYLIEKYPEAGLFATKYYQSYPKVNIEPVFSLLLNEDKTGIVPFYKYNLNQFIYYPSCLCVKKQVFERVGYYNECITYGEDIDFNVRANFEYNLAYSSNPLVEYKMDSENQITKSGISNKVITNFDQYETLAGASIDIKRFLDFNRYIMAKLYKLENNKEGYLRMTKGIDKKSLNYKQRLLLLLPAFMLRSVIKIKQWLLQKGIVVNSYD